MRRLRSWLGLADTAEHETPIASGASAEQRALLSRVYAILESLPVDVRIAWTLRHVEGEKLESVARLCGCSLATAKRRIASAQQAMDEAFGDE
jgi:RNA polymerase sigma-70 factor (ECF subfamily)